MTGCDGLAATQSLYPVGNAGEGGYAEYDNKVDIDHIMLRNWNGLLCTPRYCGANTTVHTVATTMSQPSMAPTIPRPNEHCVALDHSLTHILAHTYSHTHTLSHNSTCVS